MRDMLISMQDTIPETSVQASNDFARLLGALTAAKPTELPAWSDEGLQQDVATLSYERALRTHARYKAQPDFDAGQLRDSQPYRPRIAEQNEVRDSSRCEAPAAQGTSAQPADRKCASVTIRMSKAECDQLHARAAEAGMTVSAYLRSCTFEAEMLRSQVKHALADLRSAPAESSSAEIASRVPAKSEANSEQGRRFKWLRRMIPDLHPTRNLARA